MTTNDASFHLGLQIVPVMPVGELIETVQLAEALGYSHCMIADEGLMHDVYAVLGAVATATSRIRIGTVTNGYTRHPAATAAAMATIDELSHGRAFVTLVAGGTMVLHPLGLERTQPLAVIDDTIEILQRLWSGTPVRFSGRRFRLDGAELSTGPHDIPVWVAARGERILELAGRKADGVVLMAKADVGDALAVTARSGRTLTRIYLDRLAFSPEMIQQSRSLYAYAIMDSPARLLHNIGVDDATIERMQDAFSRGGPEGMAPLVTDEMISGYQIAGSPDECRAQLRDLIRGHDLDGFFINIVSPGLDANREILAEVAEIVAQAA